MPKPCCINGNKQLNQITNDPEQTKKTRKKIAELLSKGSSTFINYQGKAFTNYNELTLQQEKLEKELSSLLRINFNQEVPPTTDHTAFWQQNANNWLQNLDLLRDWSSWNRIKDFAKLASQLPSFTQEAATSSEIGILQRATSEKPPKPSAMPAWAAT